MNGEGYIQLVCEVLHITLDDIKSKSALMNDKYEAIQFIHTEWFDFLCIALTLDPDAVRLKLIKDLKVKRQSKTFDKFVSSLPTKYLIELEN